MCLCKLQNCPASPTGVYCIFYLLCNVRETWAISLMPWLMFRKKRRTQWTLVIELHAELDRIFKRRSQDLMFKAHLSCAPLSFGSWVMCLTNCLVRVIIPLWSSSVCLVLTRAANLNILVVRNWFLIQFRRVGRYS